MKKTKVLVAFSALASIHWQALACPLQPIPDTQLASVLRGHGVRATSRPNAILFHSKLALDDDGAPNAYHRGNADDSADPGLDHICSGADVLELREGRLLNKYDSGGSIGGLGGVDSHSGVGRSRLCKRDYIAVRDAGFPSCGPGHLCMRFYGMAVEPRSCGYNRAGQMGCGVPILQRDAAGNTLPFYLSTNILVRPGAAEGSLVQSDYADATQIPFIVMPGGSSLPGNMHWSAGDIAVVVANGRTAFAVVGDSGPSNKLGEGSRALLRQLAMAPTDNANAVTTILFPGTSGRVRGGWPLDPGRFETEARTLIGSMQGGRAALQSCPGLTALR